MALRQFTFKEIRQLHLGVPVVKGRVLVHPDTGTSIMMAGSSIEITNFDGWMLRYIWSQIKDEAGRF